MFTDHSALKSLLNTPHPSGKLARWGLALRELDLDIQYRSGKTNENADVLSRLPALDHTTIPDLKAPNHLMAKLEAEPMTEGADASTNEWQKLQREDDEYVSIIVYLESNAVPTDAKFSRKLVLTTSHFFLLDSVLYHVQTDGSLMLAVPEALCYTLFKETHGVFSGHL